VSNQSQRSKYARDSADGPASRVPRAIGGLNLLIAALGLIQLVFNVIGYFGLGQPFLNVYAPFMTYSHRFSVMSIVTAALLVPLGLLGIQLRRGRPGALTLAIIFFVTEIVCLAAILATWNLGVSWLSPFVIASGLMNGGLALQIVTAYPLLALLLLIRERRPD
jgi:hypothetical protein